MKRTIQKIGIFEAIGFIVVVMINRIIMNSPKEIVEKSGSGAWVNVIVISLIAIIFILIINKLYKKFPHMDILDISEFLGGKFLKTIIGILFLVIILLTISFVLRSFSNSLQTIFLRNSPLIFVMAFFIIGIIIANKFGFKTIMKTNLFITIFVLLSIFIIFFAPSRFYVFENLFPVLGYGIDANFLSGLTNLYTFSGIVYLFLLPPFLDRHENFKKVTLISIIISSIYLLLSIFNLLLLFSFVTNTKELLSILLSARIISLGNFFQRIDALFTLLWTFSFLSYFSIAMFFILYIFKKITNISNQNGMIYSMSLIMFGIGLLPKNYISVSTNFIPKLNYSILIIGFAIPLIILFLSNRKFKRLNN